MRRHGRKPHTERLFCAGILCAFSLLALAGCASSEVPAERPVRIVLEENESFSSDRFVFDLMAGESVSAKLTPAEGFRVTGCDYEGALMESGGNGTVLLTLPDVRYTRTVRIKAEKNPYTITYHLDSSGDSAFTLTYPASHLRVNTAAGSPDPAPTEADVLSSESRTVPLISEDGSSLLTGWTTLPDGEGEFISPGSRVLVSENVPLDLYADYRPFSPAADFDYEVTPSGEAAVTGYHGTDAELVIPAYLDGRPVTAIRERAFADLSSESVILPPTIREVGLYAFENSAITSLTFFDSLTNITDYAVSGCGNLKTIRIGAVKPPVYSGTYYDTFTDKTDRLRLLADRQKIILFSGSSARFGYDCAMIDAAFPDYEVVNIGVFAYTNALPQLDLIGHFAGEGDILVHSPEFDAAKRQFCTTDAMDSAFFRMIESDYDLLSLLDYRDYGGLLSAFSTYQKEREGMEAGDYRLSASSFDEDHKPVSEPSYNKYGDYIVFRPNASDDTPIYDLPVEYTAAAFPKEAFIDPLNAVFKRFLENGVRVCFTYAPRNREALSEKSTAEARAALETHFRENLSVPVISDIEESLYPGRYLFGTDNHLSTEGVAIRTERTIRDLKNELEKEGQP